MKDKNEKDNKWIDNINWNLLKELSDSYAISGYEESIIEILKKNIPYSLRQDRLGSALFSNDEKIKLPETNLSQNKLLKNRTSKDKLSIMLATHMDEVGFIVSEIDEQGFLKFQSVGNMWSHVLLSQKVVVINAKGEKYFGVIGAPAVHGLPQEKRDNVLSLEKLYVDMGVSSKETIEKMGIKTGDMICPYNEMIKLNEEDFLLGKAFDNRVSVAIGTWLMQMLYKNECVTENKITLAATIQEEVGLRGARTTAHMVKPDLAIAIDVTLSGDTPFNQTNVKLGKGVAINVIDSMTIMNRGLLVYIEQLCRKKGIPYQLSCFTDGGTDAGNIHKSGEGIPSMTLSIPMRYMHTHSGIIHKKDIISTLLLIKEIVEDLTLEKYNKIMEKEYMYNKT